VTLCSDPSSKRDADGPGWSRPYLCDPVSSESTPYDARFGEGVDGLLQERPLQDGAHPDGDILTQLSGVIFGNKPDADMSELTECDFDD
jgi:hypothetical protein